MFTGQATVKLDSRGRLWLPRRFRGELARGPAGHLALVAIGGHFEGLALFDATTQPSSLVQHLLDPNGRLALPLEQLAAAGLAPGSVAMLVGAGDHIELWSRERWDAALAEARRPSS